MVLVFKYIQGLIEPRSWVILWITFVMMDAVLILSEGTLGLLALHATKLSEFLVFGNLGFYNSYVHMKLKSLL